MARARFLAALWLGLGAILAGGCTSDSGPGPTPTTTEVRLTEADSGTHARLSLGGVLTVALPSNPSTGFSWSVAEPAPEQLRARGESTFAPREAQDVPPEAQDHVVGAVETQILTFDAVATGTGDLTLEYLRPFEPDGRPEQVFTVTVEVT